MSLRRLRPDHYRQIVRGFIPLSALLFGAYQQFLNDQIATTYRNKSKMYGGRELPEGEVAWR